jgi:hypothetical protein
VTKRYRCGCGISPAGRPAPPATRANGTTTASSCAASGTPSSSSPATSVSAPPLPAGRQQPADPLAGRAPGRTQRRGGHRSIAQGSQRRGDLPAAVGAGSGGVSGQLHQHSDGLVGQPCRRQPGEPYPQQLREQHQPVVAAGLVGALVGQDRIQLPGVKAAQRRAGQHHRTVLAGQAVSERTLVVPVSSQTTAKTTTAR